MGQARNINKDHVKTPPLPPRPVTIAYGECESCGTRFRRPEKNATCRNCGESSTATTHRSTRWQRSESA